MHQKVKRSPEKLCDILQNIIQCDNHQKDDAGEDDDLGDDREREKHCVSPFRLMNTIYFG